MKAIRTYDEALIRAIITTPEIWATIAEDGQDFDDFSIDCDGECWLEMKEGDITVGVYNLHPHNSATLEIHAHVLPEHRKKYSQATGIEALNWVVESSPDKYVKVIAQIPVIYENVKRFTCSFGFIEEGINRKSYRKNGEIVDQWLLGITRDEISENLSRSKAA